MLVCYTEPWAPLSIQNPGDSVVLYYKIIAALSLLFLSFPPLIRRNFIYARCIFKFMTTY